MHSCLSPCGDELMTPNNMANMAMLNGIDIIALTDHNSYQNSVEFSQIAKQNGILPVFGMEITAAEEIHILTLVKDYKTLEEIGKQVYECLPQIKNKAKIFGEQIIMDNQDVVVGEEQKLLISATSLSTDKIIDMVRDLNGVAIPAHIDRQSSSMLASFGVIPDFYNFNMLELSKNAPERLFLKLHPELSKYSYISSSDAHYLEDMSNGDFKINLEEKSVECLFDYLLHQGEKP